jgi:hypothetical protein
MTWFISKPNSAVNSDTPQARAENRPRTEFIERSEDEPTIEPLLPGFKPYSRRPFADRCQSPQIKRVDVDEIAIVVADQRCSMPDRERSDDHIIALRRRAKRVPGRSRTASQRAGEFDAFLVQIYVIEAARTERIASATFRWVEPPRSSVANPASTSAATTVEMLGIQPLNSSSEIIDM